MKGLPSAINSLNTTMALMGQNLENLNKKVDKIIDTDEANDKKEEEQDERIKELDNKSKVDIILFFKSHWWEIVMTAAIILVLVQKYITE